METVPQPVLASSVTVTDAQGRARIMLSVDEQGDPQLTMLTDTGIELTKLGPGKLHLASPDDSSGIDLMAQAAGYATVELTSDPDEAAAVVCLDVQIKNGVHEAGMVVRDESASFGWSVADGITEYRGGPVH